VQHRDRRLHSVHAWLPERLLRLSRRLVPVRDKLVRDEHLPRLLRTRSNFCMSDGISMLPSRGRVPEPLLPDQCNPARTALL
jgi:hypothetical protein